MNTVRDLINEAYDSAKILGSGFNMTQRELTNGITKLNLILDELYLDKIETSSSVITSQANARTLTIGTGDNSNGDLPDIIFPTVPEDFLSVMLLRGTSRYKILPIDAATYAERSVDINSNVPSFYYFNPFDAETEFATISFIGIPGGTLEFTHNSVYQNVNANTRLDHLSRAVRPYLVYELAYRLAVVNDIEDALTIKQQSNVAYKKMLRSVTAPPTNDLNTGGIIGGGTNSKAQWKQSMIQVDRGY